MNVDKLRDMASYLQQFADELDRELRMQEGRMNSLEKENDKVKNGLNIIRTGLNEIFEKGC